VRKFVLDTNVFIHAIRSEEARRELADWQRRMAAHIYQQAQGRCPSP
jgi:predicted nucleic acid-binding protein